MERLFMSRARVVQEFTLGKLVASFCQNFVLIADLISVFIVIY